MGVSPKIKITSQYLQILNVDESDDGSYACTIRNPVEMKTALATLTVQRKLIRPLIILLFFNASFCCLDPPRFNPLPDTYRVGLKDSSVELQCRVRGSPKPKITWYKSSESSDSNCFLIFVGSNTKIWPFDNRIE